MRANFMADYFLGAEVRRSLARSPSNRQPEVGGESLAGARALGRWGGEDFALIRSTRSPLLAVIKRAKIAATGVLFAVQ